jgi:hypothetical protein
MRRALAGLVAVAAVGLVSVAVGCGDDEAGTSPPSTPPSTTAGGQEDTTVPSSDAPTPAVAGVSLTASVRLDGSRVLFDYALANTGSEPVAVVDTAGVIDVLEPTGDGAYRAAFLRTEGDPAGGSPLPSLQGVVVAAGDELARTAGITGQFDRLPPAVQLCIEVVPQPWTDHGAGVARFPYRPTGTEPALACTDQLTVPAPG